MKKIVLIGLLFIAFASTVNAQGCSICTNVAAGLDSKSAKGLNGGIIYLAFLPLIIIGTLSFAWWKHNKNEV